MNNNIKKNIKKEKKYILNLSSSCNKSIQLYSFFISEIVKNFNISYSMFHFPIKRKKFTLLKSPHVFKKAKENFETKTFKASFSFHNSLNTNLLKLILLNKPKNIFVSIKF